MRFIISKGTTNDDARCRLPRLRRSSEGTIMSASERTHEADLDGRCERCGLLIGFHGTHTDDQCIDALKTAYEDAIKAMHAILAISRDRQAFVLQGPRGFARAENIILDVFRKHDITVSRGGS
jgi:hypothetical protein